MGTGQRVLDDGVARGNTQRATVAGRQVARVTMVFSGECVVSTLHRPAHCTLVCRNPSNAYKASQSRTKQRSNCHGTALHCNTRKAPRGCLSSHFAVHCTETMVNYYSCCSTVWWCGLFCSSTAHEATGEAVSAHPSATNHAHTHLPPSSRATMSLECT